MLQVLLIEQCALNDRLLHVVSWWKQEFAIYCLNLIRTSLFYNFFLKVGTRYFHAVFTITCVHLKTFPLNPYRKKLCAKNLGEGSGSPPPFDSKWVNVRGAESANLKPVIVKAIDRDAVACQLEFVIHSGSCDESSVYTLSIVQVRRRKTYLQLVYVIIQSCGCCMHRPMCVLSALLSHQSRFSPGGWGPGGMT